VAANLSPEYRDAQEAYRKARDPKERLDGLREMLRTIPKHKGTEHLQADIKSRIKELTEELAAPRKGVGRGPAIAVRPEGAAQIALLGPPNSGKSALHARLTGSHAVVGSYPFATKLPLPGMLPHEDVQFQLVDLPPVTADVMEPWLPNVLQTADGALLVVDLTAPDCVDAALAVVGRLADRHVSLVPPGTARDDEDPFRVVLPAVLVANKCDLLEDATAELWTFRQLSGLDLPALPVSAETGHALASLGPLLFESLGVLRVYTKAPGRPPDRDRPFTLLRAARVRDVAQLVHRGLAAGLKFARLWGSSRFEGEQVSADHPVRDGDVVELHW
jgi:hypothetical protein